MKKRERREQWKKERTVKKGENNEIRREQWKKERIMKKEENSQIEKAFMRKVTEDSNGKWWEKTMKKKKQKWKFENWKDLQKRQKSMNLRVTTKDIYIN